MKKIIILLLAFALFACKEPLVQFTEAQPENTKNINTIPSKLIGKYYDPENNIDLEITPNLILKTIHLKDTINIKNLTTNEVIKNDTLFDLNNATKIPFIQKGDTLFTTFAYIDTLFHLNNDNVLRKTKGYYFLNTKNQNNNWTVKKLKLKKGIVSINDITTTEEIKLLEQITETKQDTLIPFVVKPSKKQFREFIKNNGFTEGEIYIKK